MIAPVLLPRVTTHLRELVQPGARLYYFPQSVITTANFPRRCCIRCSNMRGPQLAGPICGSLIYDAHRTSSTALPRGGRTGEGVNSYAPARGRVTVNTSRAAPARTPLRRRGIPSSNVGRTNTEPTPLTPGRAKSSDPRDSVAEASLSSCRRRIAPTDRPPAHYMSRGLPRQWRTEGSRSSPASRVRRWCSSDWIGGLLLAVVTVEAEQQSAAAGVRVGRWHSR